MDYEVVVKDGVNAATDDASGMTVIFISSSTSAQTVEQKFRLVEVPIVVANGELFGWMGMTGSLVGINCGNAQVENDIKIKDASHPY